MCELRQGLAKVQPDPLTGLRNWGLQPCLWPGSSGTGMLFFFNNHNKNECVMGVHDAVQILPA